MTEQQPFLKTAEKAQMLQDAQPTPLEVVRRYEIDRDKIAQD